MQAIVALMSSGSLFRTRRTGAGRPLWQRIGERSEREELRAAVGMKAHALRNVDRDA